MPQRTVIQLSMGVPFAHVTYSVLLGDKWMQNAGK